MESNPQIYCRDRAEWREWLKNNHSASTVIWLIYFKKHTGKPRVPYDDAVEEALCYGWIDSTVRRIDEERYCQKFTPRRDKSIWSDLNKKRVAKLIRSGLMTEAGRIKVDNAKKSGAWDKKPEAKITEIDRSVLMKALENDKAARTTFDSLPPSQKKLYLAWVGTAKREETRERRLKEAIATLRSGKKLGMK
ncbi:MAG: YdeI/OmpD-associated family protein [Acidobacteriota bacterium]